MNLVSIGEVLWDVIGEAEYLGGAPLNFAAHAAKLGHCSFLVSAVGSDERGGRALRQVHALGVKTEYISRRDCPTGHVSVAIVSGQPFFTIYRPAAYDFAQLTPGQIESLASTSPQWIYFGTLAQASLAVRKTTSRLAAAIPTAKRFYDVNLRKNSYTPEIVLQLLHSATVVKLNNIEVGIVEDIFGDAHHRTIEDFCRTYADRFGWDAVCVTCGEKGCRLLLGQEYVESPAFKIELADSVGAGDAFAAGLVHSLSLGWGAKRSAEFANRLGALVASRHGATPAWTVDELEGFAVSQLA